MESGEELSGVRALSDGALLSGLSRLLGAHRKMAAQVVAHLGEVEERRLHLIGGFASLFAYCISELGMSEDEACRRIEVARLVRRFPPLFEKLAAGQISLSVAALLKSCLTEANQAGLLDAVSGKSVCQAREVLASWFPQPDVLPSIRKLPVRRENSASLLTAPAAMPAQPQGLCREMSAIVHTTPAASPPPTDGASPSTEGDVTLGALSGRDVETSAREAASAGFRAEMPPARRVAASRSIQPLSPERYKVQLTASAELKGKLELARDLLRHAVPSGDLAAIIERALDALLERTMKRRFGATARVDANVSTTSIPPPASNQPLAGSPPNAASPAPASPLAASGASGEATAASHTSTDPPASRGDTDPARPLSTSMPATQQQPAKHRRHVPHDCRRTVLARDEARCTWRSPDGVRCNSRAWLEYDHVHPHGLGGHNHAFNIRLLCRAHNRLAAEQAYGRGTITRIIASRHHTAHAVRSHHCQRRIEHTNGRKHDHRVHSDGRRPHQKC